jgi:hypothetical protein
MGLDIYVGTLTRYYDGAWETIVQQMGRDSGPTVEVIRQNNPSDAITDPATIENLIMEWRNALNADLRPHIDGPLDWLEGMSPPYFTDQPGWDCYSALLVCAVHEYQADPELPAVAPDDGTADAAVQRSQAETFTSHYGQLLNGTELWLPGKFDFTFQGD